MAIIIHDAVTSEQSTSIKVKVVKALKGQIIVIKYEDPADGGSGCNQIQIKCHKTFIISLKTL